jgi:hypothetical protein
MSASPIACPYCNAQVAVAPTVPNGQRVACTLCGESFALRRADADFTAEEPPAAADAALVLPSVGAGARTGVRSPVAKWVIVCVVLGVMQIMALGGLALALRTEDWRREVDTAPPVRPRRIPFEDPHGENVVTPVAPARLNALAYLPADVSLIVGAHVAEVRADKAGEELLSAPLSLDVAQVRLDSLINWTGLALADVDHLVVGVRVEDPLPAPRTVLVIRTREPYDADKVRDKLHARGKSVRGKKELYTIEVPNLPFEAGLWCADEHTLVFGLKREHLDAVPDTPRPDLDRIDGEITGLLKERMKPAGPLWVVGHARDWSETAAGVLLLRLEKEDRDRLLKVRTVAAWVEPGQTVKVHAAFHCADAASAVALERFFTGPDPAARPDLKAFPDEDWLTLQWKTDLDTLRQKLRR